MLTKIRNVGFPLLGAAGLVLKRFYAGPGREVVLSYGGNVTVSFAVYFVVANLPFLPKPRMLVTAGIALAVVELFEALNGFGLMLNVYDPVDYAANALGVALALGVDAALEKMRNHVRPA